MDAAKPVAAIMVNADSDQPDVPMPAPRITTNPDGTQTISVTVPPSTPRGIYMIAVVGTAPNGTTRVIIIPVVVGGDSEKRGIAAASVATEPPVSVIPEEDLAGVRAIVAKSAITPERAVEIVDQVNSGTASVELDGELLVLKRTAPEDDTTRPLVAALAVGVVGGSLVMIRRPKTARKVAR
jgi:hypothetical protein